MTPSGPPVLECTELSKSYGTVAALRGVSLTLRAGEVRALLGMNGAGKSTLVNLVCGSQQPDSGTIRVDGAQARWGNPGEARDGGIAVVHQEFSLVPGLSVAENITLGRWPRTGRLGLIDSRALDHQARTALEMLGESLPLGRDVARLPIAQQQIVEIAKALLAEPRVLILDEPTSALNATEVDALIALLRRLAGQGVAIIYVSHRMTEIPQVADTLTVLRDGREVRTFGVEEATPQAVAALIGGGAADDGVRATHAEASELDSRPVVLAVRGGRMPSVLDQVDLELREGEVLGIAGLLGSGRTELLEGIYGIRKDLAGSVKVRGRAARRRSPRSMLRRGVGMTPEDRKGSGIVPMLGVGENLLLSARGRVIRSVWVKHTIEAVIARATITKLSIATSSGAQSIDTLSGGNQQKAVIGRLLAAKMTVLLLDEPTRGIDVHAKAQIYSLIRELSAAGVASVFVSSELGELSEVCDRVLVLRDGRVVEQLTGSEATTERLLTLAMQEGRP